MIYSAPVTNSTLRLYYPYSIIRQWLHFIELRWSLLHQHSYPKLQTTPLTRAQDFACKQVKQFVWAVPDQSQGLYWVIRPQYPVTNFDSRATIISLYCAGYLLNEEHRESDNGSWSWGPFLSNRMHCKYAEREVTATQSLCWIYGGSISKVRSQCSLYQKYQLIYVWYAAIDQRLTEVQESFPYFDKFGHLLIENQVNPLPLE
jgi:hypothetical protein